MAFFTITKSDEFEGASVIFDDGSTQTIASDNGNYEAVVKGLLDGSLSDDDLLNLIAPFEAIYKTLTRLSERVSRKGSKLLFDGDVVSNKLSAFIIDLMNDGQESSWKAYIAFMERLYENPSKASQEHLFYFIEANGLQVTPDGLIVLYKGTQEDGYSTRAGYGIVNGIEYDNAKLLNEIGSVIEIPRSKVNESRTELCSVGLHVGAFEYVTGEYYNQWPQVWTVVVNPRDVVAVPHDFKSSKIRVARYTVVEKHTKPTKHEGLVYEPVKAVVTAPEVVPAPSEAVAKIKSVPVKSSTAQGSRVSEYEQVIKDLIAQDPNVSLRRYRGRKITAGRRDEFSVAAKNLGFKL